ncbi:hypothetical protein Tco_1505501 [Tanacetum coccineum]
MEGECLPGAFLGLGAVTVPGRRRAIGFVGEDGEVEKTVWCRGDWEVAWARGRGRGDVVLGGSAGLGVEDARECGRGFGRSGGRGGDGAGWERVFSVEVLGGGRLSRVKVRMQSYVSIPSLRMCTYGLCRLFWSIGIVMSYASSAVTYTSVYTDSEPGRVFWGADEEISDGGSPRVIVYGYDGLPMQPVNPPSLDYVPGPEHHHLLTMCLHPKHPPSPIEIPYVPEPEYPEYLANVPDSDLEEDPEEDSEEHADYPADGGDGDDEPSGDDSDDDTDDDDEEPFEDEEDDEEEEEHLAPADSSAIPVVDPVPSAGDTEAFETDESAPTPRPPQIRIPFAQTRLRRARKTVRPEPPMSASMEARIAEYAAAPTPPLPVASSPLPLPSPLTTSPTDAGAPLGYRAAGIRMRAAAASPPLSLPSTSPRTDVPEAEMPPRKRVCLTTPAPGCEIGESSAAGAARQPRPTPEVDT